MPSRSVATCLTVLAAATAAATAAVTAASADPSANPTVAIDIVPATGKAARTDPPSIAVTVIGGARGRPASAWQLLDVDPRRPVALRATKVRTYAEGDEPIAIAVVVEGHNIFMGGADWDVDQGAIADVAAAIDEISRFGPRGSLGMIVVYNERTRVAQPLGPLSALSGAALGARADYEHDVVRDLVSGIRIAVAALETVPVPRKALIVIGDGAGHESTAETKGPTASAAELSELSARCDRAGITRIALAYDAGISDGPPVIGKLGVKTHVVRTSGGFVAAARDALADLDDREYIVFPARDPTTGMTLAWDGRPHDLELVAGGEPVGDDQRIVLAPVWRPARPAGFPWWLVAVAAAGAGAVIAIALVLARRRRGRAPRRVEPIAPPIAIPPAMIEPPPVAYRTVMLGSELGMPVVGWLVPLDGASAYHTFKLRPGVTRIGSGAGADIVLSDPYVSAEHCSIASGPDGFVLRSAGAVNGCFVNDRRVDSHDLVDNDVLTLGATHVVFKSTL